MAVYKTFGDPFPQRFFYSAAQQKENSKLTSSFTDISKYDTYDVYTNTNTMEQEQKQRLPFSTILSFPSKVSMKERIFDRPPGLEEEKQNADKFPKRKYLTNLGALDELTSRELPKNQSYQSPSVLDIVQDKFEKTNFESSLKDMDEEESSVPQDLLQKVLNLNNINVDNLDELKTLGRSTLATLHQKLSSILGIKFNLAIKN